MRRIPHGGNDPTAAGASGQRLRPAGEARPVEHARRLGADAVGRAVRDFERAAGALAA